MNIAQLLMTKKDWGIKRIGPNSTIRQTAKALLEHGVGALVVTDNVNKIVGIVSERDLVQVVASSDSAAADALVSEIMTRSVISCSPDDEVAFILHQMNENAIRHMPVLEREELVGVLSIRELTKAYELLQIEANTDPLTQVSNRRSFLKTFDKEFDRARRYKHPMSVAMLDIDHFKHVNDTYGHDAGDKALRALSGLLISEFRTIDLVGRMGGEEFALVFPETDLAGASTACERLRTSISAVEVPVDQTKITMTVSIGLACVSSDMPDGSALLKRADDLLYLAKNSGRNCVLVDDDQKQSAISDHCSKTQINTLNCVLKPKGSGAADRT